MSEIRTHGAANNYPNLGERAIRLVRDVVVIVAGVLAVVLMVGFMSALSSLGDTIERIGTPAPAATECFEGVPC